MKENRDPTAMGAYALPVTPLIHFLREYIFLSRDTAAKKLHLLTILQLQEKQARSKHTGIYYSKGLCLATSPNHPNRFWL